MLSNALNGHALSYDFFGFVAKMVLNYNLLTFFASKYYFFCCNFGCHNLVGFVQVGDYERKLIYTEDFTINLLTLLTY